jgi:transmembrane sensor
MTQTDAQGRDPVGPADCLAQAADWFLKLRAPDAPLEELGRFQPWLDENPNNARAYREICASWSAVGQHASSPEILVGRRDSLEHARRAARRRWRSHKPRWTRLASAAAVAGIAIASVTGLWLQTLAGRYSTGVGERRTITLSDGSVITLDARSRMRVSYRERERMIALEQGQARFDVAKDASRPFRVTAGSETVIALGTQFNVEIVERNVLVTMIEGHVAVVPDAPRNAAPQIELSSGEALHVRRDGHATRLVRVDVERITAWQNGKIFFDNEPLSSAVERVNRYAVDEQIQVDPAAAQIRISGVFNTGDANAFIEAVTSYFPVRAQRDRSATIQLRLTSPE